MPEEAAAAQGGAAAAVVFGTSAFKRPQYAAEVQDFLQNRAKSDEVQRVQRCMELIQKATGTTAAAGPTSHTFNTSVKPRPATTHCFTSTDKAKQQQQLRQQQQLQRLSTDSSASAPGAGSCSNNKNNFLYTTTTAAAAAARPFRPCSAQPSATTFATPHTPAGAKPFRPASATTQAEKPQPRGGQNPTTASAPGFKSINITTSQAMHGLKDLYPDMWASTVPICRPDPAPNKNFISEWGESLRQGAGEAWKPYLATTSQLANLQVAKPTDDFAVRAEEALIGWVAKQQTHFADLLSPQAAAAVAALLEGQPAAAAGAAAGGGSNGNSGLSLSERKELLGVVRLLAAVVQPNRLKSTSHLQHCKQASVETPATTVLLKEQTRIRTMAFPRKVTVRGFRPLSSTAALEATAGAAAAQQQQQHGSSSAAAGAAAAAGSSGSSRKPAVRASEMIDTQKSKVPLKWAASNLVPPCSTYTSAHGKHPGSSPQMFRTHFKEVNVGMGHVDQHMYPPSSHVYPVESLYLELPAKYRSQARDVKTTYRAAVPATAQAAA